MATRTSDDGKSAGGSRNNKAATATKKSAKHDYSTGALVGSAVAGVAVGVAAMIGRKVAVQAPTLIAGNWDEALAAEHKATLVLFDNLQATKSSNTARRRILLAQLKHALAKHALQEENVVYPALRDSGETEAADHLNNDHGYVKQYLYELTNCPKDSARFPEIVAAFREYIKRHMEDEEQELFPALKAKLSPAQNKTLTQAMNKEGFKLA